MLRVDWGSGPFGGGATTSDQESLFADELIFMLWRMGVPEFQPRSESRR